MKPFFYSFEKYPYHVSGKCPYGYWPDAELDDAWDLFLYLLKEFYEHYGLKTHAFVMMRNHYHLLCSLKDKSQDIKPIMDHFHEAFTFDYHHGLMFERICNGIALPELFESKAKIIELDHIETYKNTYAYIYRNPVDAGITDKARYYPYSTLPYALGQAEEALDFPLFDNMNLLVNPKGVQDFIKK